MSLINISRTKLLQIQSVKICDRLCLSTLADPSMDNIQKLDFNKRACQWACVGQPSPAARETMEVEVNILAADEISVRVIARIKSNNIGEPWPVKQPLEEYINNDDTLNTRDRLLTQQ